MAIQFPNGVHLAYHAQACRLAYGWSGEFLNLSPAWDGRGGQRAGLKGPLFWTSPEGFPWDVTDSAGAVPDFSNRGKDTELGAELPQDGKLYPTRLNFRGYKLAGGPPTFRFSLELGSDRTAEFSERVSSLRSERAHGSLRETTVTAPPGNTLWLQAALSERLPEWRGPDNTRGELEPGKGVPATSALVVTQEGKPLVLHLRGQSPQAEWLAVKQGDKWSVVLRAPAGGDDSPAKVSLVVWRPIEDGQIDAVVDEELRVEP